jgi:hypothetical protein
MNANPIPSFIGAVRRRLDRGVASRLGARCLLAAAGACVLWAVAWRIFGYAAPWPGYAVAGGAGLVAFVISTMMSKRSEEQAAAAADEVFGLKDGLLSWLGFRAKGSEGEVFDLHERSMAAKVAGLEVAAVPVPQPRRQYGVGLLLAVIAGGLAFLPHSQAVRDRLAREELTAERSAEVKKQVEEAVEEQPPPPAPPLRRGVQPRPAQTLSRTPLWQPHTAAAAAPPAR